MYSEINLFLNYVSELINVSMKYTKLSWRSTEVNLSQSKRSPSKLRHAKLPWFLTQTLCTYLYHKVRLRFYNVQQCTCGSGKLLVGLLQIYEALGASGSWDVPNIAHYSEKNKEIWIGRSWVIIICKLFVIYD